MGRGDEEEQPNSHCSMIGENVDSLALRSTSLIRSASCHEGSAIAFAKGFGLEAQGEHRLGDSGRVWQDSLGIEAESEE